MPSLNRLDPIHGLICGLKTIKSRQWALGTQCVSLATATQTADTQKQGGRRLPISLDARRPRENSTSLSATLLGI